MSERPGSPSDEVAEILATGRSDITTLFVSMSARHPEGKDADYLEWHTLDHRPEQYRLASIRSSLRLVSTPACRAARAVSDDRFDALDHLMTYFFSDRAGLEPFFELGPALGAAGRMQRLPSVEMGAYGLEGKVAARRLKIGADVLPWWPPRGVYLIVERGTASASALVDVPGVGGVLWAGGTRLAPSYRCADTTGLQMTYAYLDRDPVEVAGEIRPALEKRWAQGGVVPLLAAPLYPIVPYAWSRFLPV